MKIVLKQSNTEKVAVELAAVQKRAKVRTITDCAELEKLVADTIAELGAAKNSLKGCRIVYTVGAGVYPASYRGIPEATQAVIELGADGLGRLIGLDRVKCNYGQEVQLYLTQECAQSILRNKYGAEILEQK